MSYTEVQSIVRTLGDVLSFIAPFAGGVVPDVDSAAWNEWVSWAQDKQEEYARRGFWRRCLTYDTISLTADDTVAILPDRFHKPNGLYMFIVDEVDWNETPNSDRQTLFVEMINDITDENFGSWQVRFKDVIVTDVTATIWYFSNPPVPNAVGDILLLPGNMVAYATLAEYYRQANQEGSQDDARGEAENRFQEYLGLEVIPDKSELLVNSENPVNRIDRLQTARGYYSHRTGRNTQT